ncbi:hypothetical protein QVL82_08825 [Cellulosimicrobium funkei]
MTATHHPVPVPGPVADAVRAAFEREGLGAPGFLLATPSAPAERVA